MSIFTFCSLYDHTMGLGILEGEGEMGRGRGLWEGEGNRAREGVEGEGWGYMEGGRGIGLEGGHRAGESRGRWGG